MEDLFPLFVIIIGAVGSIVSSISKEKTRKAAQEKHQAATAERMAFAQQKQQAADKTLPPTPPVATASPAVTMGNFSSQQITPTVHPHVQPDCDTHDKPGSLGVTSLEGKDPCHEAQLTHPRTADDAEQEASGLTFDWSGENMVKAFVMQEVLTRPAKRMPVGQPHR